MSRVGIKVTLVFKADHLLNEVDRDPDAMITIELAAPVFDVLGIQSNQWVEIDTLFGTTIVRAKMGEGDDPAVASMAYGPSADVLLGRDTHQNGPNTITRIDAHVFRADIRLDA